MATVEKLTGVHIDHFAEVNLDGFYELAKVLGGVEVCLNHPVPLTPTPASIPPTPGYQHLNAEQALAFVRQRDGLPNGDLDRTHRQQAFLDSVIAPAAHRRRAQRPGQAQDLLTVAKQYVITDAGWNLLDFAAQAKPDQRQPDLPDAADQGLRGRSTARTPTSSTRPTSSRSCTRRSTPRRARRAPEPATASATTADDRPTTVDVYNGGNTPGLAGGVRAALVKDGYTGGKVGNATSALTTTEVLYGTGTSANASKIASLFNVTASASSTMAAGHVEILLGADATLPGSAATSSPSPSSSAIPIPSTGAQGGAVNAKNGIPCVRRLAPPWQHGQDPGDRREGRARRP